MNYIQKLKRDREILLEFFHSYVQLDAAHKLSERTAYKGDARTAIEKAYVRINAARKDIEDNILPSILTEEVKRNVAG